VDFEGLFRSGDARQDNLRSRLFGLFSEEVVRFWADGDQAPYEELGRPTLWTGSAFTTLDFTLRSRSTGLMYVAEQKVELAFEGYRYLRLTSAAQIQHHATKRAFDWFLDLARDPTAHEVKVKARHCEVAGAILVWGAITPKGRASAIAAYGLADVLSLEDMLRDLQDRDDPAWRARVAELRDWADGLLAGLTW
jgi:hypothetical protein